MTEIEKLYENANIKPEYRYDCNLADTIKPLEVFPLCNCSKGEIKDYCTNKQDYRYCKVYKVNKIYPPFTAEKQLELIKWLSRRGLLNIAFCETKNTYQFFNEKCTGTFCEDLATSIATLVQCELDFCTDVEKEQIKEILND